MCWNVKLFVRLIFNIHCRACCFFGKTTRVVPWNSDFPPVVLSLKSMLLATKCSGMPGWILRGTNTQWFTDTLLATAFPRSFLIFITLSYEIESPRSDKHSRSFLLRVSLITCLPSPYENGVSTTSLKFVLESVM